ncbi:MAG: MauE/DoxX family redox-associated membrane protein [Planctomycetota bacterium]
MSGRRWIDNGVLLLLARLVLGATLLTMGFAKVGDPVTFLKLIREYGMVPEDWPALLNTMAVTLPWVEVVCGALLVLGVALRGAAATSLLMLIVFTIAIASRAAGMHADGVEASFCDIHFDCGCGGGDVFVCSKLAENAGLLLAGLVALVSRSRALCLKRDLLG